MGTLRREYLDRILFWTTVDLVEKLTGITITGIERMPDWKDAARTGYGRADITNRFQILPVAKTLSRVVSDSHRSMIYKFAMDGPTIPSDG